MKVAHFGIFAPHASGQYETVKDLILAERSVGVDAQFIDCGSDDKDQFMIREGLEDRGITTMPLNWALDADVTVRHSVVPDEVYDKVPVVLALHGRPESSFRLEYGDKSPVLSSIAIAANSGKYKDVFTFWPEHLYLWEQITGKCNINYIPAPVNLEEYTPDGEKHDFGNFKAGLNLVIADIWRDDVIPFNLIFAAQFFRDNYQKDSKLHIYGVSNVQKKCFQFLANMQKTGVVGEVAGVIGFLPKVYRAADILLTPNTIATRIVRESMASGLPIVAPHGCAYTKFTAEPRDYKAFAASINDCHNAINNGNGRTEIRLRAEKEFNFEIVGNAMKKLFEKAIQKPSLSIEKPMTNKDLAKLGRKYCNIVTELEYQTQRTRRRNERAIEIAYVFKNLTKYYPSTVLDVGTGPSSLPHIMSSARFEVDAIDEYGDYWKGGLFNRHFKVDKQDILNHTIKRHYDFITCVSTIEHILDHKTAIKNMVGLLNPDGVLIITCPYNEERYIENIYKEHGAGYGQNFPSICQVFSNDMVEGWANDNGCVVVDREYWQVFNGKYWTFGRQIYPPVQTSKDEPHQLICLTVKKK